VQWVCFAAAGDRVGGFAQSGPIFCTNLLVSARMGCFFSSGGVLTTGKDGQVATGPILDVDLYGNTRILEENLDAMLHWIDFQKTTSTASRRPFTIFGDWLAIDAVTPARSPVPGDLTGTACFAHTTGLMESACGQFQDRLKHRVQFWSPCGSARMPAIDVAVKNETLEFQWN
jgi:hypothetical protein